VNPGYATLSAFFRFISYAGEYETKNAAGGRERSDSPVSLKLQNRETLSALDPTHCAYSCQTPSGADGGGGDSCISLSPGNRPKLLAIDMATLLYGCGLRLSKALRLRAKDVEFGQGILAIRDAKGGDEKSV
jgi:integrase